MSWLIGVLVWSVLGLVFFLIWTFANSIKLTLGLVSPWKIWAARIIGGPIVWLAEVLSDI